MRKRQPPPPSKVVCAAPAGAFQHPPAVPPTLVEPEAPPEQSPSAPAQPKIEEVTPDE